MDTHVTNELISNSYHYSSENAEINIDNIVAAVAKLNVRILQLREEIVTLKNENTISSVLTQHSSLSLAPAGFNHSTKNGENRTGARYELRRNFKGDDSPSGTDLSARLSFAKRAREVKAANEAAVFKEDYPRDDKSIEDDERPNRSRVSKPSGTYRKSISDAEKSGKEADERSGNVRDRETGDTRILRVANEKLRKLDERQNEVVNEMGCSPANLITSKIKRKRISRGVQCVSIGCRGHAGRSLFSCFKSRRYDSARKAKRKKANFDVGPRNKVNKSSNAIIINDKSRNVIKEEIKSTCDADTKKENFEKIDEEKIGETCGIDKELLVRPQNMHDDEKSEDDSKYQNGKVKINLLEKLRLRKASRRKNDSKAQQNVTRHESQNHREEIVGFNYENRRADSAHKCEDNSQSINIVDRQVDVNNERKTMASADRGRDVNKIKERLDSCIAELNGIIGDACAIFGNKRTQVEEKL